MSETKSEAHTSAQHLFLHDPDGREPSLDFVEYWRTLRKYKWAILALALVVTLVAGVIAFVTTPIYEAKATVLIELSKQKVVSIEDVYSGRPCGIFGANWFCEKRGTKRVERKVPG